MLTVLFTYFMSFEVDVFRDIVYTSKQNRLQFVFVVKATALKQQNIRILPANSKHKIQLPHLYQSMAREKLTSVRRIFASHKTRRKRLTNKSVFSLNPRLST